MISELGNSEQNEKKLSRNLFYEKRVEFEILRKEIGIEFEYTL